MGPLPAAAAAGSIRNFDNVVKSRIFRFVRVSGLDFGGG